MPLYFITGISGSGKSTVLSALKHRGYDAYDVDEAGPVTAKWQHNTTGFIHPKSSIQKADRTSDFLKNHSWRVERREVEVLANLVGSKIVFLGGSIANETELQDLFQRVFALTIVDDTLKHRLAARSNNDWGKSPHELAYTLAANHKLEDRYRQYGYVVIDASQSADTIITEILNHVHDN